MTLDAVLLALYCMLKYSGPGVGLVATPGLFILGT